jgi:WD40 repeat protein
MDQPDITPIENTHSDVLDTLASRFWTIVNPDKDTLCMQIQPPHLVVYPSQDGMSTIEPSADESTSIEPLETENAMQSHLKKIQAYYNAKSKITNSKYDNEKQPPSLFQLFLFNMLQNALVFIMGINVPSLLLCVVMIAIIIWMTPTWREQWLMPFIKTSFEQSIHALIRILPLKIVKMFFFKGAVQNHPVVTKSLEYEADGIQHRGAIAVQNMFNQQQYRTNVKQVRIKTLTRQHTADIYQIDANAKNSIVSYGHDGKIVLWDSQQAKWVARLDEMTPVRGTLQARLNPDYFQHAVTPMKRSNISPKINIAMNNTKISSSSSNMGANKTPLFKQHASKPSCIKVDPSNRWIATGYYDGLIRIWNINTGMLVRELNVATLPVQVQHETNQQETSNDGTHLENRFTSSSPSSNEGSTKRNTGTRYFSSSSPNSNRTLHMQFIGTVTEYCHPIVAEAAARCKPNDGSLSCLVSVHKGGIIREWDIVSGECIQTIHTGHTRDITQLHVTVSRAPHRKAGITWVFTASKDGLVKCFERCRSNKNTKIDPLNDARHQYQEHEAYYQQQQYDHFQQEQQPCQNKTRPESTQWDLVYTLDLTAHGTVTCIETELPVGGMGVLVTGSRDGTVKVWNFETGEALTTLSVGRYQRPTSASSEYSSASSLKGFSRFPGSISLLGDASSFSKRPFGDDFASGLLSDTDSATTTTHVHSLFNATSADHHGSIHQVVVTRYCEVENGPGVCSACDTCFGNGFLVASSSIDNKVHSWRLERSDAKHEASCTLCTKDYHRKQYRHRKINSTEGGGSAPGNGSTTRRRRSLSNQSNSSSSTSPKKIIRHTRTLPKNKQTIAEDAGGVELLDIEQLAGDSMIPLSSSFLGVVDQPGGYGLVFCDKILAGVRRTALEYDGIKRNGEWEVWFASLQYYDPTANDNSLFIPIESFHLDTKSVQQHDTMNDTTQSAQLNEALQDLFNTSHVSPYTKSGLLNKKRIHLSKECIDEEEDGTDMLEAGEILPFSTVRRVIPLDGSGIACDFGNFIKLVFLDRPSLTQKEQMRIRDSLKKENASFHKDTKRSSGCCGNVDGHGSCCSNGDILSDNQSHQNTWW